MFHDQSKIAQTSNNTTLTYFQGVAFEIMARFDSTPVSKYQSNHSHRIRQSRFAPQINPEQDMSENDCMIGQNLSDKWS